MNQSVDIETLSMLKDVMEEDFHSLIETFLNDARERIPLLKSQLATADAEAVRQTAHSLKGSSSNLGAVPMSELCFQIESRAGQQRLDGLEPLLQQLQAEFSRVETILQDL